MFNTDTTFPVSIGRTAPKQQRSRETYHRILDAADELFAEQGFHNTQIMQIIERSGSHAGSLYRFFPDKTSIADALVARHDEYLAATALKLEPAKTLDELLVAIEFIVHFAARHRVENPGYRAAADVLDVSLVGSPLYNNRERHVTAIAKLASEVASHLSLDERKRIARYAAEIVDALLHARGLTDDPADRVKEITLIVQGYVQKLIDTERSIDRQASKGGGSTG